MRWSTASPPPPINPDVTTPSVSRSWAILRNNFRRMNRPTPDRIWLLVPVGMLYGLLALLPIGLIVQFSFADGASHYADVLGSHLLLRVVQNTVAISLITTIIALL